MNEIYDIVNLLRKEIQDLKEELDGTKAELKEVKCENEILKQAVNLQMFRFDELEQHGRRENIRIHGIPESNDSADDGEKIHRTIAEDLHIELNDLDIQRVYRLGRKKKSTQAKPRTIIARFVSYRKRNQFMYAKSQAKSDSFTVTFIRTSLVAYFFILFPCDFSHSVFITFSR